MSTDKMLVRVKLLSKLLCIHDCMSCAYCVCQPISVAVVVCAMQASTVNVVVEGEWGQVRCKGHLELSLHWSRNLHTINPYSTCM